jgi:hypothetical protein
MTGTSRVAFGAVTATFVPSGKQIALARSRDEGSWCHPIAPPHLCGDLSLPYQGAALR